MNIDSNRFIEMAEYKNGERDRVWAQNLESGLYVAVVKLGHTDYPAAKLIVEVAGVMADVVGHTVDITFLDDDMRESVHSRAKVDGGYATSFEGGVSVRPAKLGHPVMPIQVGYLKDKRDDFDDDLRALTRELQHPAAYGYTSVM